MRKRTKWIVVGTVLTIGLLSAAAATFFGGLAEARAFALKTLPAICTNWDEVALREHLNQEKFSDADVKRIAMMGKRELGALKSFTVKRATISSATVGGKSHVRLCYSVPASFEKAIDSSLVFYIANIDGRWQLVDFDVTDPKDRRNNLFKPAPASVFPKGSKPIKG
jgi:hypothetical protein